MSELDGEEISVKSVNRAHFECKRPTLGRLANDTGVKLLNSA